MASHTLHVQNTTLKSLPVLHLPPKFFLLKLPHFIIWYCHVLCLTKWCPPSTTRFKSGSPKLVVREDIIWHDRGEMKQGSALGGLSSTFRVQHQGASQGPEPTITDCHSVVHNMQSCKVKWSGHLSCVSGYWSAWSIHWQQSAHSCHSWLKECKPMS